jgi:hypothetical protein
MSANWGLFYQAPSIKQKWHNDFNKEEFLKLCKDSLKAQLEYVAYNPLRFGKLESPKLKTCNVSTDC